MVGWRVIYLPYLGFKSPPLPVYYGVRTTKHPPLNLTNDTVCHCTGTTIGKHKNLGERILDLIHTTCNVVSIQLEIFRDDSMLIALNNKAVNSLSRNMDISDIAPETAFALFRLVFEPVPRIIRRAISF